LWSWSVFVVVVVVFVVVAVVLVVDNVVFVVQDTKTKDATIRQVSASQVVLFFKQTSFFFMQLSIDIRSIRRYGTILFCVLSTFRQFYLDIRQLVF